LRPKESYRNQYRPSTSLRSPNDTLWRIGNLILLPPRNSLGVLSCNSTNRFWGKERRYFHPSPSRLVLYFPLYILSLFSAKVILFQTWWRRWDLNPQKIPCKGFPRPKRLPQVFILPYR